MSEAGSLSYSSARATRVVPSDDQSIGALVDAAFGILRRRWLIIIAGIILGIAGGFAKTALTPVTYIASTSILLENQSNQLATGAQQGARESQVPMVTNEVQSLRSPALMERVVRELQLQRDPDFNPYLARTAPVQPVTTTNPVASTTAVDTAQIEATKASLMRSLNVDSVRASSVIVIKMRASDPVKAARIVDAVAQGYLAEQLDAKLSSTRQASIWLQQQVDQVGAQLKEQSAALQAERAASGLNVAGGSSLADQQVTSLSSQLSQARAELAARQARAGSRDSLGISGSDGVSDVMGSGAVQALRAREGEVQRRISELAVRYGPSHPQMQVAREQLNDIRRQIQEEMGRVSRGSVNELQVAQRRVAAIEAELARWTAALGRDTRRASVLQQLQSQVTATEATYQGYVQRLQQITDLEKLQRPDARIIVRAQIPGRPASPNPTQDLAQGLLAGLVLAGFVIVLLESLQRGLRTPQAVEDWTGAPCLVSVPKLTLREVKNLAATGGQGPADYVAVKPLSLYAEALRQLRADLILAPDGEKIPQVILFSSAVAGEGKSTTALAFARTLAMSGAKTILIEADIRRPTIANIAGIEAKTNLVEVINHHDRLEAALSRDLLTDLDILPTQAINDRTGVDQALERFSGLLDTLRPHYQFIVVDTAPVLAVAETQTMARQADAVILVVRWGTTTGDAIRIAVHELQSARITPRGVALNSVDFKAQSKYTRGDSA
ncbi:GumC family protein, partial [Aquidulcibacter paucihalophilus]|uniref:GumC family protein n=1 Tax=Aquidulcibacter paucihalophilus TaxID=1978549 RepID=UPI000A18CABA